MNHTIEQTLDRYLKSGHEARTVTLGDDFAIVYSPSFDVLPDHPYRSPFVVALFCRSGRAIGRVNMQTFEVRSGSFFIVLSQQITELVDVSSDFRADYVLMSDEFVSGLGIANIFAVRRSVTHNPCYELSSEACEALDTYIRMCSTLIATQHNPHRREILTLLTRAFFLGFGYYMHSLSEQSECRSRGERIVEEFLHLVEDNYCTHRNLGFYAERLSLTAKHLSTVVGECSGYSATEWIERYVTLDAITQLCSTSRTVKEIAYDLGFPSQSFFGKYFTRVVGISPAAYRAKHNKYM